MDQKLNVRKMFSMLLIVILFIISIILSINLYTKSSLIFSILASVSLIVWIKNNIGNYTNISLFFVSFSMLYGISGPINTEWGEGLSPLFSIPYHTDEFIFIYAIANIGLVLGISLYYLINKKKTYNKQVDSGLELVYKSSNKMINISISLVFIGSIFEIINLIRIGGLLLLFQGKASYQSLSSTLVFTLPSDPFVIIAFSLMALSLSIHYTRKKKISFEIKSKIILFVFLCIPYILINTILGKRGALISLFICILIGVTFFKPIKRVKPRLLIVLIVFYIFISFLSANRAIVPLLLENSNSFISLALSKERMLTSINPGRNEFGSAFGNFSQFYGGNNNGFTPKLGESYVEGLVIPIPSFIYPYEKPRQITYEFRDKYFPSEAIRGVIAGTGFSSILEAYINFKEFGVFFIYAIYGYLLQKIDVYYKYKNISCMMMYVSIFPLAITFHRRALGVVLATVFLLMIVIWMVNLYFRLSRGELIGKNRSNDGSSRKKIQLRRTL